MKLCQKNSTHTTPQPPPKPNQTTKRRRKLEIFTSNHKALSHRYFTVMPWLISKTQASLLGIASGHCFTLLPLPGRIHEGSKSLKYSRLQESYRQNSAFFSQALLCSSLFEAASLKCGIKNKTWFLFISRLELLIHLICVSGLLLIFSSSWHSFNYFSLLKWVTYMTYLSSWLYSFPFSQFNEMA